MNEHPRKKLQEIINKYGSSICSNHLTLDGLLRDISPGYRKEIFALTCAIKEGIVADLLALNGTREIDLHMTQLANRLKNNLCLSSEAATWAVDSWALALKIVNKRPVVRTNQHKSDSSQQIRHDETHAQNDMPASHKDAQGRVWEGNSYAIFQKTVEASPKPFRQMTERKLLEALSNKAGPVEPVSENLIVECINDVTPQPFRGMVLKTIKPLRTRKTGFVWKGTSKHIFEKFAGMFPSVMGDMARTRLTNEITKRAQDTGIITEKMVIESFRKVTSGSFFMEGIRRIQELKKDF